MNNKLILSICFAGLGLQPTHASCMLRKASITAGIISTAALATTIGYKALDHAYINPIHWDWQKIDTSTIEGMPLSEFLHVHNYVLSQLKDENLPVQKKFLLGAGTSAYQVERDDARNTQWNLFDGKELEGKIIQPAGIGCDAQNHEDEDIQNLVNMGFNAYRFSVAWEKIYPHKGIINHEELKRYKNFCVKLKKAGIEPVITLHHYTEPRWFYEMGGFEKAENIPYFVEFCKTVFQELHPEVYLWLTFNAPESIALTGWMTGAKPPAKKDMELALDVLYNLLEAHVAVYRTLKELPGGEESRVGILKNILQLDPYNQWDPRCQINAYFGQEIQNEITYRFFTTGHYFTKIPRIQTKKIWGVPLPTTIGFATSSRTNEYIKNGGKCLDFIGLNYYSHNYITADRHVIREQNPTIEVPQANPRYTIYGEGLYRAIKEIAQSLAHPLGIPIYVTENGIGTDNDDHRELHNKRYLYALAKAIYDGYDVRGYIHWSLMDNYEWGQYKSHYGIYQVDRSTNALPRSLKKGSEYFKSIATAAQLRAKQ